MSKYFGELHVFKSGVNSKYIEIDFIGTEPHLLVKDTYQELINKIKTFLSSVEEVIDDFHQSELEGVKRFHSGKFIYFYRIDIFKKYDFNDSCWLYRTLTRSGYNLEYLESPIDVYSAALEKIEENLARSKKRNK